MERIRNERVILDREPLVTGDLVVPGPVLDQNGNQGYFDWRASMAVARNVNPRSALPKEVKPVVERQPGK